MIEQHKPSLQLLRAFRTLKGRMEGPETDLEVGGLIPPLIRVSHSDTNTLILANPEWFGY